MINRLNSNIVKLYNVFHHVSVDESMILFKGQSAIKQCNPSKKIKRGFKLWSLADMDGYLYHCEVYQGKNQVFVDDSMPKYFGLGPSIVYQLTKPLHGKHHQVFIDNYFSMVLLMEYLLHHQVYCCGTIRSHRKYLRKNLKTEKTLQRGEFDYRVYDGELVFYKWKDNKVVTLLFNFHVTESAIRKENLGVHGPIYDKKRGRCEVCAKDKQEARPHIKCSACDVFLCLNEEKNCFAKFHDL